METTFTPYMSLFGGSLIGLSAVLLMMFHGRIMGATGILAGVLFPESKEAMGWRLAIVLGMISGPLLLLAVFGYGTTVDVPVSRVALVIGGLIVGIGVTFGAGCTSGHGVCGMARISQRSIVATLVFMVATAATVYVTRHLIGA